VVGSSFSENPLTISTSSNEAGKGELVYNDGTINGSNKDKDGVMTLNGDGQTFVFTPSPKGPSTLYYSSTMKGGIGGRINIIGACQPNEMHICVTNDGKQFIIDNGQGNVARGQLTLQANVPYTFEMVGVPDNIGNNSHH
jgi:hypothetical protein